MHDPKYQCLCTSRDASVEPLLVVVSSAPPGHGWLERRVGRSLCHCACPTRTQAEAGRRRRRRVRRAAACQPPAGRVLGVGALGGGRSVRP
eukprot:46989-Rhodomonas_salina.1